MVACPYCGRPAMTFWQKLKTGSRHTLPCRSCGRKVSVSRTSLLAVLVPVTAGAFIASEAISLALGTAAIIIGGTSAICIYLFVVPVSGREG